MAGRDIKKGRDLGQAQNLFRVIMRLSEDCLPYLDDISRKVMKEINVAAESQYYRMTEQLKYEMFDENGDYRK